MKSFAADKRLDDAVKILAKTAGYSSFCPASAAKKKVSLEMIGSIDEIAEQLSTQNDMRVIVDHDSKSVWVSVGILPRFESVESYEHKPAD